MNEVLFRKANDRIDDTAQRQGRGSGPIEFYCECSDRDCAERVPISAHEFEAVHAKPTQFIVKPGHQVAEIEIVVLRTPLYLVVEKTGEAAEYVTEKLDDG